MQDKVQTCLLVQYLSSCQQACSRLSYHLTRQDTKTVLWSDCHNVCGKAVQTLTSTVLSEEASCPLEGLSFDCQVLPISLNNMNVSPLKAIHFPAGCIAFLILYMTREWIIFPFICTVESSRQNYATRLDFFVYLRAARPQRIQRQ